MTFLPRLPQISVVLLLGLSSGCVTVVPMQTATVVPRGGYRLGGSTTVSTWCSVSLDPQRACNAVPLGVPTPELRLAGRHGLAEGLDLGASLAGEATLGRPERIWPPRGYQLGLFVDAKKEVWSRPLDSGRRQLVSIGPGLGYTSLQITDRTDEPSIGVLDVALPVYFGHQTKGLELVASVKYVERFIFSDQNGDGRREMLADGDLALSFGVFGRGATKPGIELGYQTGIARPLGGLFNVSVGLTFDFGLSGVPAP